MVLCDNLGHHFRGPRGPVNNLARDVIQVSMMVHWGICISLRDPLSSTYHGWIDYHQYGTFASL